MRKTIEVKRMLKYANLQLERTDGAATQEFKSGICTMIESLLMGSGNYQGYMNLPNGGEYCRVYYMNHKLT
jgi:hypothetical protein